MQRINHHAEDRLKNEVECSSITSCRMVGEIKDMSRCSLDNMYYSFDDNYTTHFSFDIQRRMMIFSFDYYYDDNLQEDVLNPCNLVIKDWTSIQYSLEPEDEYFKLENSSVMPELALILKMKQEGNNLFLYAMSDDNEYINLNIQDATVSLELVDMTKNVNVYKLSDSISDQAEEDVFMARIPYVRNKVELLEALKSSVRIPSHITCNWDVMPKLLEDPFWLSNWRQVIIVHDGISELPKSDLSMYRKVIAECRMHSMHTLFVFKDNDYSLMEI